MPGQSRSRSFGPAQDWGRLRAWDGSQYRAFEELCFQVRDPAPPGWRTVKTGNPDGGVEWYDQAPDGCVHGSQAKFVGAVDELIPLARESVRTVGANRGFRNVVKLTLFAPFDMPEPAPQTRSGRQQQGARQRWNDAVHRWKNDLPGVADIEIDFVGGGELLERLSRPGNEGRRWFFFNELVLGPQWCADRFEIAQRVAQDRYTPQRHIALPTTRILDGLAVSRSFQQRLVRRVDAVRDAVAEVVASWARWRETHEPAVATAGVQYPPTPNPDALAAISDLATRADILAGQLATTVHDANAATGVPSAGLADLTDELAGHLTDFRDQVLELSRHIEAAWPAEATTDADRPTSEDTSIADRRRRLAVDTGQHRPTPSQALAGMVRDFGGWREAANALDQLQAALSDDAARAAETGAWLLLGPAGQGKTHLLLDGTSRALADGRLAVVVFGDELKGADPLTEIARRLGLGDLAHDMLLQAIDAAGAASNARFLLIIDAINDSDEAFRWKTQLPALLARIADYPHVAIALSCRSTLRDVVVPANLDALGLPHTTHPGFDGHEVEALERYLRDVPHALPRTPLLLPAFSNPLFVKLYAEGLRTRAQRSGQPVTVAGTQHRSAVFDLFLDTRAEVICDQLHLDPTTKPVHRAVEHLAARMAETGREVLDREKARTIVDAFAPSRTNYPDTMLGKLQAHGILATDRCYIPGNEPRMGVAFPYQAFSDDRIVRAVLERHHQELDRLRSSRRLATSSALRGWLQAASPALQEAATVVLPELAGVELIDILEAAATPTTDPSGDPSRPRRYMLFRALLNTLPLREATSVTQRTVDLLNQAIREFGQGHAALDSVLAVTTEPDHPLNADRLHRNLLGLTRPQRDAWWGVHIYSALQEHGPLHRLLRWAEQLPTPNRVCPDRPRSRAMPPQARRAGTRQPAAVDSPEPPAEVVRLAATTLVWTLTSSNRFLRDRATKALVQLLLGYPDILTALLAQFLREDSHRVDDPYLFERLVLVAYGVVLRAGPAYPEVVGQLARELIADVYGDQAGPVHASSNALLCNAARGIIGTAARMGVISKDEAEVADHPHPARRPGNAPTTEQIETRFPSDGGPGESWGPITFSLREQADFANYKVRPAVHRISRLLISHQRPTPTDERRGRPRRLRPSWIAAFRASLPTAARDVIGTVASAEKLLHRNWVARKVLSDEQYRLLQACKMPPPRDEQLFGTDQDEKWAARWIIARVAALGWTPARLGEFDRHHGHGGRSAHKAERIGKKYQWMALHELGERLINHYHANTGYEDEKPDPAGFWQTWLRDIDPSLPPGPHRLADEDYDDEPPADNNLRLATFPPSPPTGFWPPPQPELPDLDHVDDWIVGGEPLPTLEQIAVRVDEHGVRWVVLSEYVSDTADGRGFSGQEGQAEQWHHVDSWLVRQTQFEATLDFLEPRMLVPRWMPEARQPSHIYLAEFPDAPAAYDPHQGQPGPDHELRFIDYYAANDLSHTLRRHQRAASTRAGSTRASVSRLLSSGQDQETMLVELARLWSPDYQPAADIHDDNDSEDGYGIRQLFDSLLSDDDDTADDAEEPGHVEIGRDSSGAALQALPATQDYGWEASGADCSIDAHVNVHLPANALLAGVGLTRHPDRTDWYDETGTHIVTSRRTRRATGEVTTLLAREDWLDMRLQELGFALVLGLFGNRIPATTEPEQWREYSQAAGRVSGAAWRYNAVRTRVK